MKEERYREIERAIFDYREKPDTIINPVEMAADFGVMTAYANFDGFEKLNDKLGYYRIDVESDGSIKNTICCKEGIDPHWLSFTLSHELGHYFIYKYGIIEWPTVSTIVDAMSKKISDDPKEQACDHFARVALMPEVKFRSGFDFYRSRGYIEEETIIKFLASDFQVPPEQARLRCLDLGVIK